MTLGENMEPQQPAPHDWRVTFECVVDAAALKSKLEACAFFRRCDEPKAVKASAESVVLAFRRVATRQDIVKKCTQTFGAYGKFRNYAVVDEGPASATGRKEAGGEAALASETAPSDAGSALALRTRTSVDEVLRMVRNFSRAECHALLVHTNLAYAAHVCAPMTTAASAVVAQKTKISRVFIESSPEAWRDRLTEYAANFVDPSEKCACNCGCKVCCRSYRMCTSCSRFVCANCWPHSHKLSEFQLRPYHKKSAHGDVLRCCHACAGGRKALPKLTTIPLEPPRPVDGLRWYFHFPWQGDDRNQLPARWCKMNRDPACDPQLIDIKNIYQRSCLENNTRLARPPAWESAFDVLALLGGADGAVTEIINLFSFMMNPQWRSHPLISYVADDWLQEPRNYEYVGFIINPPALRREPAPPSPPSPWMRESNVVIDEISTDEEGHIDDTSTDKESDQEGRM